MRGLVFEANAHAPVSAPERADVACFVGFVRRTSAPVSPEILQWLDEHAWGHSSTLKNVPAPFERWNDFARHFHWEGTYLGAAVRSFFAQGGRKCYIVRVDDPWSTGSNRTARTPLLQKLLPGTGELFDAAPHEQLTWTGAAHLFGLPDVSFLCLPDLAAVLAVDADPLPPLVPPPAGPEVFVDCSEPMATPPERLGSTQAAPRCDEDGYAEWARFLARVRTLLSSRYLREVQLVTALPLPYPGPGARVWQREGITEETPYSFLLSSGLLRRFQSAFIQLVYPWARTSGSELLPEGLESPDGLLTGVLARNALLRGTFRSALNLELVEVQELFPVLGRGTLTARPQVALPEEEGSPRPLVERISALGPTPGGLRVLSDVTTSRSESWRQAGLNRLFSVLVRAARQAGQEILFEPSSERTWLELGYQLESVLVRLWEAGALRGERPREAFQIRCDRTTMTQDDLDAGRLVAEVEFDAAPAIERIHVVLTMAEGGTVTLQAEGAP